MAAATTASAQEPLIKAKELYTAAAYEEALIVLAPVEAVEANQYRALCLLALGRGEDATRAIELLIAASPMFVPSDEDLPPRYVTLVSDARRRLLPAIARRLFGAGREQFHAKAHQDAMRQFELVLALTSDPVFKESTEAQDLRTLASGFIDLARTAAPPTPEPRVAAPRVVATPVATPVEDAPAGASQAALDVIQPVVIRQTIPGIPPETAGLIGRIASVRVQIDPEGKVTSATIDQPAHPLYDRLLLQATRDWLYKPASLNGRAVGSEKVVTVQLR